MGFINMGLVGPFFFLGVRSKAKSEIKISCCSAVLASRGECVEVAKRECLLRFGV